MNLSVTQTVEIIPSSQSNLLDTCLVHYRMKNEDTQSHHAGLRFLLDTYIGDNDGVPFDIGEGAPVRHAESLWEAGSGARFHPGVRAPRLEEPGHHRNHRAETRRAGRAGRVTLGGYPAFDLGNSPNVFVAAPVPGCDRKRRDGKCRYFR